MCMHVCVRETEIHLVCMRERDRGRERFHCVYMCMSETVCACVCVPVCACITEKQRHRL